MTIPEEQTDLAMGVVGSYPIQGVEVLEDKITVTFEQNDWQEHFQEAILTELSSFGIESKVADFEVQDDRNWNAEWEASIDPVVVNDRIMIVPDWKSKDVESPIKLLITPKMSFGTGHHATTRMMCKHMETYVRSGDTWIDVGTGTGVLAVLAAKLGAKHVFAFDIDEWSIVNAQENVDRNDCAHLVKLEKATLGKVALPNCDGLAANLYRHLVIPHAEDFIRAVKPGGHIILSGILKYDADDVSQPFLERGCQLSERLDETEWCALAFTTPKQTQ